jgi:hypothetical protein
MTLRRFFFANQANAVMNESIEPILFASHQAFVCEFTKQIAEA